MLRSIDENGTISWHCIDPECSYHNCAAWDREQTCPSHPTKNIIGEAYHTAHVSDPDIVWSGHDHIMLPVCPECGSRWGLNVHSDVAEPIIKRDELTGKILQVAMPQGKEHHGNLWIKDADIVRKQIPHPSLEHMSTDQIQQMQADMRNKAATVPVEWMLSEAINEDIHAVYPHPAVARHQELARQLQAIGKVYVEPPVLLPEPMVPLSQVKELVHGILKEHGIDPLEDTGKQQAIQAS